MTKNKILYAIPSHKRADSVTSFKVFPKSVLFVAESQEAEYRKYNPDAPIVVHPDDIKGLTPKLNWILDYAVENGYDAIVKCDDDARGAFYLTPFRQRLSIDEVETLVHSWIEQCRDMNTVLFTINETADLRRYDSAKPVKLFSPIRIGLYGIVLKDRNGANYDRIYFDERMVLKQDIDMAFQVAFKYHRMLVDRRIGLDTKPTMRTLGGCSEYRNFETERNSIEVLMRKWGSQYFKTSVNKGIGQFTIKVQNPLYK